MIRMPHLYRGCMSKQRKLQCVYIPQEQDHLRQTEVLHNPLLRKRLSEVELLLKLAKMRG